jgi:molecular chaperone GrpE
MAKGNHKQEKTDPVPTQEVSPVEEMVTSQTEEAEIVEAETPVENIEPAVEVNGLQKELDEARLVAAEYLDGWQRSMAEFANYKKRVERDREQSQQSITGTIVKRYLEVVDDLERALKTRPKDGDGAVWADGVELIYRKLLTMLDSQDVKTMDALGKPFDPTRHEAIGHMESSVYPSGHIAEVVQNGYLIGDRILRPALVRIVD